MKAMEEVRLQLVEGIRVRQEALNALSRVEGAVFGDSKVESRGTSDGDPQIKAPAAATNGKRVTRFAPGKRWSKGRTAPFGACRGLEEPFCIADLAKVSGLTKAGASSQIYRWAEAGLLVKKGPGLFERSPKFPPAEGDAAPAAVVGNGNGGRDVPAPSPKLVDTRVADLEKAIKEACVERDKNRANSRDRMAQVYQDKIDKLQRELEAVQG